MSLGIGLSGRSAAQLAEAASGQEKETLFESQRMEELPVRIRSRRRRVILTRVEVILNFIFFKLKYLTTSKRVINNRIWEQCEKTLSLMSTSKKYFIGTTLTRYETQVTQRQTTTTRTKSRIQILIQGQQPPRLLLGLRWHLSQQSWLSSDDYLSLPPTTNNGEF